MAVFVVFWLLLGYTALRFGAELRAKPREAWVLDLAGLAVQGALVPFLQGTALYGLLILLWPAGEGRLEVPPVVAFLLAFVAIDYLYYWNHRLLHTRRLWPIHAVHHSLESMDVLGTSRNTLWSSFFIVYVWLHTALLFVVDAKEAYALGVTLTACLDLWRHSRLDPPAWLARPLGGLLILPRDHAWHHADDPRLGNFGANLALWDRLHGSYVAEPARPPRLGLAFPGSLARKLLWPFGGGR